MPRAVANCGAQGLNLIPFPVDPFAFPTGFGQLTATERLRILDVVAHEWLGIHYYRFKGYVQ